MVREVRHTAIIDPLAPSTINIIVLSRDTKLRLTERLVEACH